MPSPSGHNRENLYAPAAWFPRNPKGAYDSKNGLGYDAQPEPSPAAKVAKILVDSLSQDELNELGHEVVKARDASLDPYATKAVPASEIKRERNSGGSAMDSRRRARIAQDAKFASVMKQAFARPGSKTYDRIERRKIAADAAVKNSLTERYPDIARIGIEAPQVDPKAGPHSMANDGRLVRSLEERYPDLKKIGFA
jgi:hypothetical protein